MRTKKLKWGNPLFVLFLAVAGIFGVSSALVNKQVNDSPIIEKAEAATHDAGSRMYFRFYSGFFSGNAVAVANYEKEDGGWHTQVVSDSTTTKGGETIYYIDFDFDAKGIQILRKSSDQKEQWGYTDTRSWSGHNFFEVTGYGVGKYMNGDYVKVGETGVNITTFYFATPTGGSVTLTAFDNQSTNKGTLESNTTHHLYSNWTVNMSAAANTNYSFASWTNKSGDEYVDWTSGGTTNPTTVNTNENLDYSARFPGDEYSITYKGRGNVALGNDVDLSSCPTTHTYGTDTPLVNVTRSGYIFDGWYTNSECSSGPVTSLGATSYTSAITLYGKFRLMPSTSPVFYLVGNSTFNQSSGIGGAGASSWYDWEYNASSQVMAPGTEGGKTTGTMEHVYLSAGSQLKTRIYSGTSDLIYNDTTVNNDGWSSSYASGGNGTNINILQSAYFDIYAKEDQALKIAVSFFDITLTGKFYRYEDDESPITIDSLINRTDYFNRVLYNGTFAPDGDGWTYNPGNGIEYSFQGWYTDDTLETPFTSRSNVTSAFPLYAKFVDLNDYVTYDHNDGGITSPVLYENSLYGSEHTVQSLSELGWEPSRMMSFDNWATNKDGTGDTYVPGDTFNISGAVTLYAEQSWNTVYISIDNGETWHSTTRNAEGGYRMVYKSPANLNVRAGYSILKFKYVDNTSTETTMKNSEIESFTGNNYNTSTGGVNVSFEGQIELRVTTSNALECYIPGASEITVGIIHGGSTTAYGVKADQSDSGRVNCLGMVYARKGDILQVGKNGYYEKAWVRSGDGFQNNGADYASSSGVTCTVTGAYVIYVTKNGSGDWHDVWTSRDELQSASYFAFIFNNVIGGVCDINGNTNKTSLLNAWQVTSGENAKAVFNELSETSKGYLTTSSGDSDSDILRCKAKYDYILGKYGYTSDAEDTSKLYNFLGRTPSSLSAYRGYTPFSLFDNLEDNLSTIIIIAASSIALVSIGALSILIIKKRKTKEE